MSLVVLTSDSVDFPDPETALSDPNGLLAIGGELSTTRLLAAYAKGIFPWYSPQEPILWWSPDPRAVLFPNEFHISRSFQRFLRTASFNFTLNHNFSDIISSCAYRPHEGTWLNTEMQQAYLKLHQLGHAHSVEVWQQGKLVGGLYGIAQGALFCGESMFSRVDNASKCALMVFCQHFYASGGQLFDCQVLNPHTASLGAKELSRSLFLQKQKMLIQQTLAKSCWLPQELFL